MRGPAGFSAAWQGSADWARTLIAEAEAIGLQAPDAELMGMRFYDGDGKLIYEGGYKKAFTDSYYKQHEILL